MVFTELPELAMADAGKSALDEVFDVGSGRTVKSSPQFRELVNCHRSRPFVLANTRTEEP